MLPLVSAIMPTRSRRDLANQAMHAFFAQTYPNKELVIVDDITDRSFEAAPDGTRYIVMEPLTIGAKRNVAVELSTGDIIIHWDSDDRYHPERIEHQVNLLLANEGADIVGYNEMEFVDLTSGKRWNYTGSRPLGVSLCYWRRAWEQKPFRDQQTQEEYTFMDGRRTHSVPANRHIVATNHADNTSQREPDQNPAQWRKIA